MRCGSRTARSRRTPATSDTTPARGSSGRSSAPASYQLGPSGWAYLAAINQVESNFDQSTLPGVHSATNADGAAGPMQHGIGAAAGNT